MAKRPSHAEKPVDGDDTADNADRCRGGAEDLDNVYLMLAEIVVFAKSLSQASGSWVRRVRLHAAQAGWNDGTRSEIQKR